MGLETLERLGVKNIYSKLHNIQQELEAPKSKSAIGGRYHYRSADDILAAVKPLLKKNKCILVLSDEIKHFQDEGKFTKKELDKKGEPVTIQESLSRYYVEAKAILYCSETGDKIGSKGVAREAREKLGMDVAQLSGSSSSYARKYALAGLFSLDDEKDIDDK